MISGVTFIAALFERSTQGAGFVSSSASSTIGSHSPETMAPGVSIVFRELTEKPSSFRFSTLITNAICIHMSGDQNFPISFAAIERSFCRRARSAIGSWRTQLARIDDTDSTENQHRARMRISCDKMRIEKRVELSEYNNRRGVAEWKFIGGRLMLLIGSRSIFEKRVNLAPTDKPIARIVDNH